MPAAWDPITGLLDDLHQRLMPLDEGAVADYIPELAHADAASFGIAVSTLDGVVYATGDADVEFTIQSVSKPFVLALVIDELGLDEVLRHVDIEPSGDSFNAISLEPATGRPANPMINAGAMLTTSLCAGSSAAARFDRIRSGLSAFAGRELSMDEAVYRSEDDTGDRNRALAWLMRGAGSLRGDVEETVETYFRQCAIRVSATDLAIMAATLANGGLEPRSGTRVVTTRTAEQVLSVMATCGMYDGAGEWMLRVGMPAKSGVSGGLLAVLPAQFGIGLYSPPLDPNGNTVRGVAACRELSERFGLHLMHVVGRVPHPLDPSTVVADGSCLVWAMRGDIGFASAESIARGILQGVDGVRWLVLDVDRVSTMHPAAQQLLGSLVRSLQARGIGSVVADAADRPWFDGTHQVSSVESAIGWAEAQRTS